MAKWPRVEVKKIKAKTRGGARTYSKTSIEVSTEAPCGKPFTKRSRANEADIYSTENEMKTDIDIAVRVHMSTCSKKQCIEKR